MFHTLEFENLRGVKHGKVEAIAPLSVFVGPNNSGKSTLLEGFHLAASAGLANTLVDVAERRGWCGEATMEQLFFDSEAPFNARLTSTSAVLESRLRIERAWPDERSLEVSRKGLTGTIWTVYGAFEGAGTSHVTLDDEGNATDLAFDGLDPNPAVRFIDVGTITDFGLLEDSYSKAVGRLREQELEDLVRELVGHSARLRILKKGERHVLHVIEDEVGAVAVYNMGDGFKRLLYLACVFAEASGQLVLLEEPEAFQHPRYLRMLASMIWTAVEQGTQVVLSTHSEDLLQNLFGEDGRAYEHSAVFKTRLVGGELRSVRIDGSRAHERVAALAEDLRL